MMESLAESSASLAWLAIRSGYSKCCTCQLPANSELNLGSCVFHSTTKSDTGKEMAKTRATGPHILDPS